MEIMKFRSREEAKRYAQACGLKSKAKIRMLKRPSHKWANRVGNVPVLFLGSDPGGDRYLFADGFFRYGYQENVT